MKTDGVVWPEEDKAPRRPVPGYFQYLNGTDSKDDEGLFMGECSDRTSSNGLKWRIFGKKKSLF